MPELQVASGLFLSVELSVQHCCLSFQFFTVEVYHSDGTPITADQLCVQLERICNSSLETNTEHAGILTTLRRDAWYKYYNKLVQGEHNYTSIDM